MPEQKQRLTRSQLRAGVKLDAGFDHVIEVVDGNQRICIADHTGKALPNTPYCLEIGDETPQQGMTDAGGLTALFEAPSGTTGRLVVGDQMYRLTFAEEVGDAPTDVQSMLNGTGWQAGPLDGDIGEQTRTALRAFQRSANLERTGEADDDTVAALRSRMGLSGDAS
jgi:hypothetical protein